MKRGVTNHLQESESFFREIQWLEFEDFLSSSHLDRVLTPDELEALHQQLALAIEPIFRLGKDEIVSLNTSQEE